MEEDRGRCARYQLVAAATYLRCATVHQASVDLTGKRAGVSSERANSWLAQAAGVSWLTLNLEASVIRFLGVAENGGAVHPTIFRRPGLRKHD